MNEVLKRVVTVNVFFWISSLGIFTVTQWLAASLGYSPVLGRPTLNLWSFRVYSPLVLIRLSESYGFSPLIKSAQFYSMLSFVVGLCAALTVRYLWGTRLGNLTKNVFGDAAFATFEEIKQMGVIGKARGVFLGKTPKGDFIRHDGPEHYAVIAPTRSGKGAGIVVPTLLTWRGSCVVYDLKEENFQRTAGARSVFSDIIYFNPNSLNTHHFNPLLEIRPGIFEVRDAQNIANMIIEPDKPGVQDHWVRTGNSLLTAAILHVLYAAPPEEKNLAGVASLLSRPEKSLTDTLMEMLQTKHRRDESGVPIAVHPGVAASVRDVLNKSPDDKSSVVSTVMGYLAIYRDPLLANATRDSDFTIDQ